MYRIELWAGEYDTDCVRFSCYTDTKEEADGVVSALREMAMERAEKDSDFREDRIYLKVREAIADSPDRIQARLQLFKRNGKVVDYHGI